MSLKQNPYQAHTKEPEDTKSLIHKRLIDLSDSLCQSTNRTQKAINADLNRLKKSEFNTETRIASVAKEEKLIQSFNEQTRYGTFFVWIVLIICTVVFFVVVMFLRTLG